MEGQYKIVNITSNNYPLMKGEYFNAFSAGDELKYLINEFCPDAIEFEEISKRKGSNNRSESLFKCHFKGNMTSEHFFYIYACPIESGGRPKTYDDEARIQFMQHALWKPDLNKLLISNIFYNSSDLDNKECYILGIYKPQKDSYNDIICAFPPATLSSFELSGNSSKSMQTRINSIQEAYLKEVSMHKKTDGNVIISFKPQLLFWYMKNRDELHLGDLDLVNKMQRQNQKRVQRSFDSSISDNYLSILSAIRTKPFILLAGISGTGKSRIVRELARTCWAIDDDNNTKQKPDNFDMIPVKPNWHDSSELLGYKSNVPIPHYVPGDFLKFVVKAWTLTAKYGNRKNNMPCFLCLDEMNLAPVEQYFAEYLSCIESRDNKTGEIKTDAILKPAKIDPVIKSYEENNNDNGLSNLASNKHWYTKLLIQLLDEANCPNETYHDLYHKFLDEGISIPSNLIVMGTVNMDETTFAFSRKVLDRAMTFEMNDVNLRGGIGESSDEIPDLSDPEKITILGTRIKAEDIYLDQIKSEMESMDQILDWLENINEKLEETPFKIAYRTRNEIILYVINSEELGKERLTAFDEAINMKILPRIEGDANKVGTSIDELINIVKGLYNSDTQIEETESAAAKDEDIPSEVKRNKKEHSPSLKKLNEMKKRMMKQYYCTYWS